MRHKTVVMKIDKQYRRIAERAIEALHDEYATGTARYIQAMSIWLTEAGQELCIVVENAPPGMQLAMHHFCKGFAAGFRGGARATP